MGFGCVGSYLLGVGDGGESECYEGGFGEHGE